MLSSNNIKNILTNLFNKNKEEHDKDINHLKERMDEGWISSGTIENIKNHYRVKTVLWNNKYITATGNYTLEDSIENYDELIIYFARSTYPTAKEMQSMVLHTDMAKSGEIFICPYGYSNSSHYSNIKFSKNILTITSMNGTDGSIYAIDGIKYDIVMPQINMYDSTHYSENEQLVGQWINGKPLYRKTISGNTGNVNNGEITILSDNTIEELINSSGYIYVTDAVSDPIGTIQVISNSINRSNRIYFNSSGKIIVLVLNTSQTNYFKNKNYSITLEYTKTTDTPFSIDEDIAWVALDSEVDDIINKLGE